MFGMLDYRAHKLYILLTFPIDFPLYLISIFAPATILYFVLLYVPKEGFFLHAIIVILSLIIADIGIAILTYIVRFIPNSVFNFLIDPIPCDGRSKKEALLVVRGGDKAILLLKFNKPANCWTDDDIESVSKITIWHRFFQDEIQRRLYIIQNCYYENPQIDVSEYQNNIFIQKMQLQPKLKEKIVTSPYYRHHLLQFFLIVIIIAYATR